jgi:hypothetical protein
MKTLGWISLVLSLCACGGGGGGGAGGGGESGGGESGGHQSARELIGIAGPEKPWSEMSHEEREMDMVGRFLPIMSEFFQEHDGEEFASFGCESCHGTDMSERHFEMPSPQLPPVPLPGTPQYEEMREHEPEMTRFMEEDVTPAMQTMLGMGATFTCNGCHPTGAHVASDAARF